MGWEGENFPRSSHQEALAKIRKKFLHGKTKEKTKCKPNSAESSFILTLILSLLPAREAVSLLLVTDHSGFFGRDKEGRSGNMYVGNKKQVKISVWFVQDLDLSRSMR